MVGAVVSRVASPCRHETGEKRYGAGMSPAGQEYSMYLYHTTIFRQREEPAAGNDQTDVCAELISILRAWASSWREYGFLMN